MENEKKGIKCSYAVLVIILFAALAFVTSYTFIQNKTTKCSCPDCSAPISVTDDATLTEKSSEEIIDDQNENTTVVDSSKLKDYAQFNNYGQIVVTKDGNVYYKPYDKYNLINGNDLSKVEVVIDQSILGPEEEDSIFRGYKVNTSNIRSAYSFEVGNGGALISVVLITKDNKVEILNLDNSNGNDIVASLEKISELSNIVTATKWSTWGGNGYVLYDINGNQYPNGRVQ